MISTRWISALLVFVFFCISSAVRSHRAWIDLLPLAGHTKLQLRLRTCLLCSFWLCFTLPLAERDFGVRWLRKAAWVVHRLDTRVSSTAPAVAAVPHHPRSLVLFLFALIFLTTLVRALVRDDCLLETTRNSALSQSRAAKHALKTGQ